MELCIIASVSVHSAASYLGLRFAPRTNLTPGGGTDGTDTLHSMAEIIRYRCRGCGNKTRFDVTDAVTRRRFSHYSLGGELTVEEEEILEQDVLKVVCRWCDRSDAIEEITE